MMSEPTIDTPAEPDAEAAPPTASATAPELDADDQALVKDLNTPSSENGAGGDTPGRRWRLALGSDCDDLASSDQRLNDALSLLYDDPRASNSTGGQGGKSSKKGGLGKSKPRVAAWLGDVRELFPTSVVQLLQKDAMDRLGLQELMLEPEIIDSLEADVSLVADLISLRSAMPEASKETARQIIAKVVAELMKRLEQKTAESLRGAVDRGKRTFRPRFSDIDWGRTIAANLSTYQAEHKTIIPEKLVGFKRKSRRQVDLDEVILCVDQSGSMAPSVIYASIFAAVMASLPVVKTKLVCFDTAIADLTDDLADPVEVLFGVQLGGGTDINAAVAYCQQRIEQPSKAHMILITDLCEGGNATELVQRIASLKRAGINVIVLLALSDEGKPYYDANLGALVAALGVPVFGCTPDQFPDLMATALKRQDVHAWAADQEIKVLSAEEATIEQL